jgi:KDO2-lipid IV(A) lauroyltransferase
MARKPTLLDRLEYALFRAALAAANRGSEAAAERWGERLGRLGYRPLRIRRAVVEDHLHHAFPERSTDWIAATAEAAYAHLGRELMAMLRLSRLTAEDITARVRHEVGLDAFHKAYERGHGIVLVGGHFGNWEIGAASLAARGYPVDAIYQPQRNPLFDAAMVEVRRRLGLNLIPRSTASKVALQRLREGRVVAFVADQNAGRSGVFVPFFGRLASTHRGAALMAVRSGAPLFFGAPIRRGEHYLAITQEIATPRADELGEVVHRLTADYTACLENLVRQWPEQYFWHHRRWKTRPPGGTK